MTKKLITEEEIFKNDRLKDLGDKSPVEQKITKIYCGQCKEETKVMIAMMSGGYQMGGKILRGVCPECYPNLPQSFHDMISKEIKELGGKSEFQKIKDA